MRTGRDRRPDRDAGLDRARGAAPLPAAPALAPGPPHQRADPPLRTRPPRHHADVTELGNIPDGGGWRYAGRAQGEQNRAATAGKPRNTHHNPRTGTAFVHTVIDDHSRVAYAEIHDDETAATATAVLHRAVTRIHDRGVVVERVLTDNGSAYCSHPWRDTCAALGITPKRARPYRPQTNGKIGRSHRTLKAWLTTSSIPTEAALPAWLHDYKHHRPHTAIGRAVPINLTNLAGQHT